ncbi:MAG: rhodanese-like domain-containing protein [Vicinamibacterales bacterium]
MGVTVVALVGLSRADVQQPPGNERAMALADFQPLHAQGKVMVVDVRDADSFANGHIPGAVHVPVREIEAQLAALKKASAGRVLVTYCSCPTEASSLRAAQHLSGAGLRARALVGGFPRWVEAGGAIERDHLAHEQRGLGGQKAAIIGF